MAVKGGEDRFAALLQAAFEASVSSEEEPTASTEEAVEFQDEEEGNAMQAATLPPRSNPVKKSHKRVAPPHIAGAPKPKKERPAAKNCIPGGPCGHCGATGSPQWRRPLNEDTVLCNACGIYLARHKVLPKRKPAGPGQPNDVVYRKGLIPTPGLQSDPTFPSATQLLQPSPGASNGGFMVAGEGGRHVTEEGTLPVCSLGQVFTAEGTMLGAVGQAGAQPVQVPAGGEEMSWFLGGLGLTPALEAVQGTLLLAQAAKLLEGQARGEIAADPARLHADNTTAFASKLQLPTSIARPQASSPSPGTCSSTEQPGATHVQAGVLDCHSRASHTSGYGSLRGSEGQVSNAANTVGGITAGANLSSTNTIPTTASHQQQQQPPVHPHQAGGAPLQGEARSDAQPPVLLRLAHSELLSLASLPLTTQLAPMSASLPTSASYPPHPYPYLGPGLTRRHPSNGSGLGLALGLPAASVPAASAALVVSARNSMDAAAGAKNWTARSLVQPQAQSWQATAAPSAQSAYPAANSFVPEAKWMAPASQQFAPPTLLLLPAHSRGPQSGRASTPPSPALPVSPPTRPSKQAQPLGKGRVKGGGASLPACPLAPQDRHSAVTTNRKCAQDGD